MFLSLTQSLLLVVAVIFTTGCAAPADDEGDDETAADNTAASAQALSATGFKYSFQNWDHDGTRNDNPVALVFVSTKPDLVDRVYAAVEAEGLTHSGSKMSLSGVGGSRPGVAATSPWHSESAGRKGAFGCWGHCAAKTDIHIRTYGADGQAGTQVYQGSAGIRPYYLIATVHFDVSENTHPRDLHTPHRGGKHRSSFLRAPEPDALPPAASQPMRSLLSGAGALRPGVTQHLHNAMVSSFVAS